MAIFFVPKDAQCSGTYAKWFFPIFIFWDMVNFLLNFLMTILVDCIYGSKRTWFRNSNEWYPVTSWLGGLYPKVYRAWGWCTRRGVWGEAPHEPLGLGWRCSLRKKIYELFFPKFSFYPILKTFFLSDFD